VTTEQHVQDAKMNREIRLRWFRRMRDQTPWLSPDGTTAIFTLFAGSDYLEFRFRKLGLFWYYDH
jgi:hypothetical protein